ncbi:MAG: hypothetical protein ACR2NP_13545 [Pirellulaceae bacterium]
MTTHSIPAGQPASQPAIKPPLAAVQGRRTIAKFGTFTPAFFGQTTLELHNDRVVELTTDQSHRGSVICPRLR